MCSLSYSGLENWLRVHLLGWLYLLDEASKGAIITNVSPFFHMESTTGLVLLCYFFFVSALYSQTHNWSWQMAALTESSPAGGFFLLKGSFPLHRCYMHVQ
ncbi:hypothetical protein ATANTOWER_026804 [Ataeniobius toweri]|uniref:Uncharacterized protein n=1 Tax=Ataeniobius toweri TaxID=208326 RepID=A0ABU7CCW1_9TELE|nr:hypothetical protein [Ataeniobius toweri]